MTETEWLAEDDPRPMLRFLDGRTSDRKLRLFALGGVRRAWASLSVQPIRDAVAVAERFADGAATADDLRSAGARAGPAFQRAFGRKVHRVATDPDLARKVYKLTLAAGLAAGVPPLQILLADLPSPDEDAFRAMFAPALLRCVAGNPFHPIAFDARWRTADGVGLARGIYEDRAFDRLPLLADALMDAGCDDEQVLGHCRSGGPHARGCWVVDMMLGKE